MALYPPSPPPPLLNMGTGVCATRRWCGRVTTDRPPHGHMGIELVFGKGGLGMSGGGGGGKGLN